MPRNTRTQYTLLLNPVASVIDFSFCAVNLDISCWRGLNVLLLLEVISVAKELENTVLFWIHRVASEIVFLLV